MTRRLLSCVLALCLLPGLALAAKTAPTAAPKAAPELVCPASAGVGEPFLVRLRLARPVDRASVRFMGRSAPLELRKAGQVWEAVAVLGSDVLDCRPGRQDVSVRLEAGGRGRTLRAGVEILRVKRPVESLTLAPEMVDPPGDAYQRIAHERALVRETLARSGAARLWSLPLSQPVAGTLSSGYGIGRILNGEPKSPHRGIDLEAEMGAPVSAATDGVVALTGDFYYTGRTIYLDHGQGLFTMYFHLSEARVAVGQHVARGQVIGLVGDTGRATSPHLHFGVAALGRLVDPGPLFLYDVLP